MMSTSEYNLVKRTGWGTIILGGLAALYAVIAFFSTTLGGEVEIKEIDGFKAIVIYLLDFLVCLSMVVGLVGGIVSWWHRITGGILLILAGVIMVVLSFLPVSFRTPMDQEEVVGGPFGAPFLIAGVLIIWIWWRSKRRSAVESES
jgi:hypothetical protein